MAYVENWKNKGYKDDIPDFADSILEAYNKVPSYRKIVLCILKNDFLGKSLGYEPKKSRVYNEIKRQEISQREGGAKSLFDL